MRVELTGPLRSIANGAASVEVEAATIQELMNRLLDRYPAMQDAIDRGVAVAINSHIFRDDWTQPIPDGAEVVLMPRIEGG